MAKAHLVVTARNHSGASTECRGGGGAVNFSPGHPTGDGPTGQFDSLGLLWESNWSWKSTASAAERATRLTSRASERMGRVSAARGADTSFSCPRRLPPPRRKAAPPWETSVRREWRVRRRDGSVSVLRGAHHAAAVDCGGDTRPRGRDWPGRRDVARPRHHSGLGALLRRRGRAGPGGRPRAGAGPLEGTAAAAPETAASAPAAPSVPTEAARPRPRTLSTVPPAPVAIPRLNRCALARWRGLRPPQKAQGRASPPSPGRRAASAFHRRMTGSRRNSAAASGPGWWGCSSSSCSQAQGRRPTSTSGCRSGSGRASEQARNSQLERDQAEREARLKAAEQRAKEELLQSLAAAQGRDAGTPAPDAGASPRGALEPPAPPASAPAGPAPAEARVPSPTLATGPNKPPSPRAAPDAEASGAAPAAPRVAYRAVRKPSRTGWRRPTAGAPTNGLPPPWLRMTERWRSSRSAPTPTPDGGSPSSTWAAGRKRWWSSRGRWNSTLGME